MGPLGSLLISEPHGNNSFAIIPACNSDSSRLLLGRQAVQPEISIPPQTLGGDRKKTASPAVQAGDAVYATSLLLFGSAAFLTPRYRLRLTANPEAD